MTKNFKKLESKIRVSENVNKLIIDRMIILERQCWTDAHYPRHECLETVGDVLQLTQMI